MAGAVAGERRTAPRTIPPPHAELTATLRPGCAVVVRNVSAGGALVMAFRPMRPGARVQLQVTTGARRVSVTATIVRCSVVAIHPLNGATYAAGVRFEHPVDWRWSE